MTKLGLGRTAWAAVVVISLLNMYAILPSLTLPAAVAACIGLPIGAFLWVHFLKSVLMVLGGGEDASQA